MDVQTNDNWAVVSSKLMFINTHSYFDIDIRSNIFIPIFDNYSAIKGIKWQLISEEVELKHFFSFQMWFPLFKSVSSKFDITASQ